MSEEGLAGEVALLLHYNGYSDDVRTWDVDRLCYMLSNMQRAMRMLDLRHFK